MGYARTENTETGRRYRTDQLAADTKGALSAITDFTSCFEGCTGLTNLPEDLFAMATGAETFDRASRAVRD